MVLFIMRFWSGTINEIFQFENFKEGKIKLSFNFHLDNKLFVPNRIQNSRQF